jgi:hypothetical protein
MQGWRQDKTQVLIELPGGERRLIPIEWTDWGQIDSYPQGIRFPVEQLLHVLEMYEQLQAKLGGGSKMAAEVEGGSHGSRKANLVAANDGGAETTRACHPGADALEADGERSGRGER